MSRELHSVPKRCTGKSIILFLGALLLGCTENGRPNIGSWVGEEIEEDGVRVVRTISGSVWEKPRHLVEELSIGSNEEGPYLFESITGFVFAAERFYVLDGRAPVLRIYDSEGHHLRDVGRSGEGPGEFRRPEKIAVDTHNQKMYIRDYSMRRMNVYSLRGDPLDTWHMQVFFSGGLFPMKVTDDGSLYTAMILREGNRYTMMSLDSNGTFSDKLWVPQYEKSSLWLEAGNSSYPLPFSAQRVWNFGPSGTILAGYSDEYRIELWKENQLRLIIERPDCMVPIPSEESSWHREGLLNAIRRGYPDWVWRGPGIPKMKPAFSRLIEDNDGRIWVFRAGEGMRTESGGWRDTTLIDVFDQNGKYLGNVIAPAGIRAWPDPYISDDYFIAQYVDEEGVPYLRKYRISGE